MLISHKLKIIFSHIPRTAGGSFRDMIKKLDSETQELGHYHSRISKKVRQKYPNYATVTIVRNSYHMLASRYRYQVLHYRKKGKRLRQSFKQYYSRAQLMGMNQLRYIIDKNGTKLVDHILYHKNIVADVKMLGRQLKIKFPTIKKTKHYHGTYDWKQYYEEKGTKELIDKKCAKDIEYFGWKFGD